jgi:exonuclease III
MTIWESFMPKNGELGTSIILKPKQIKEFTAYENEKYVLVKAKSGKPITYYVGTGWTKNPHFKIKQEWLDYVNNVLPNLKF